jgi:hypothetical protein
MTSETTQAELLLTCLRLEESERKLAHLQGLTTADWVTVLEQARLHGVSPLLYWQIRNIADHLSLPESGLSSLRSSFLNSAARSLLLYRELAAIVSALQPQGIPVILLKGLHLAKLVYPEPALRHMADIDLLLRLDDLPKAVQTLQEMGYSAGREFKVGREVTRHQHIPPLYQPGKAPVELHWTIAAPSSPLKVDLDGLWARAQPAEIGVCSTLVLATEDLLLHLSLHLLQDEFIGGLRRLYDIATLASRLGSQIDWTSAGQRAAAWGCQKSLFLVLHMACQLLGATIPSTTLDWLRPNDFTPQIDSLARQRILSLTHQTPELHPDLARLRRNKPLLVKTGTLLGTLFPYPEYVAAKYSLPPGSKKIYFYYLVRLKDLARRYGWQFWRVLRSDEEVEALAQRENALSDWWMAG